MKEVKLGDKGYLKPEFDDVLNAKVLGTDHVVEDWPWGRQQRCSMHFFIEKHRSGKGERLVKQSTFKGRVNKPKRETYSTRVLIVELDGKIGVVRWAASYGIFGLRLQDGKYLESNFFDKEAEKLRKHFFS